MLKTFKKLKKPIYLDHAATTFVSTEVLSAMQPFWQKEFGNPSSIYDAGERAKLAIESARFNIAKILDCRAKEILFTGGGTESINTAIFGVVRNFIAEQAKNKKTAKVLPHIITTAIEHDAVLKSFEALGQEDVQVTLLQVDREGFVDLKKLTKAIKPNTILVSVMYANNEIGTVQPISEIAGMLRKINKTRLASKKPLPQIVFHTDACQASGALNLNVNKLGVDLMTLNASKIYGPKQVGLLYIRSGVKIKPLIYGGGQENGLRSGTENTPGVVGFAKALEIAEKSREKETQRLISLRDGFYTQLKKALPNVILNGPEILSNKPIANKNSKFEHFHSAQNNLKRLPNNINISIPNVEGETLMLYLDLAGIIVSTGSACSSTSMDPSHVLMAIGRTKNQAQSSIRMTLGKQTTKDQLVYASKVISSLVKDLGKVVKLNKA